MELNDQTRRSKRTTNMMLFFITCLLTVGLRTSVPGVQAFSLHPRIQTPFLSKQGRLIVHPASSSSCLSAALTAEEFSSPAVASQKRTATRSKPEAIPFLIERLPDQPSENIYTEISQMCINAFFNDGATSMSKTPFWKEWQLSYLRTLQESDLRVRRRKYPGTNMMFIARQVQPVANNDWVTLQKKPLVLDLNNVYNLRDKSNNIDYVEGEVLGFVEVTLRPYSLGNERAELEGESRIQLGANLLFSKRPVLTNLSVKYEARKSGVGSRLMEVCERQVQQQWSQREIILEVEDDNQNAIDFYQKRGFEELYEDPAGRRYDTNGFLLRQLRCCRKVMRKDLRPPVVNLMTSTRSVPDANFASSAAKALQRLRDSLFSLS